MEFRRGFDTIPEQFDRYRPRYATELFADLIDCAGTGSSSGIRMCCIWRENRSK